MSIKTTYSVTRELAINAIMSKLRLCNDRQLSNILEEVVHNEYYNFSIESEKQVKESSHKFTNIDDLPKYSENY